MLPCQTNHPSLASKCLWVQFPIPGDVGFERQNRWGLQQGESCPQDAKASIRGRADSLFRRIGSMHWFKVVMGRWVWLHHSTITVIIDVSSDPESTMHVLAKDACRLQDQLLIALIDDQLSIKKNKSSHINTCFNLDDCIYMNSWIVCLCVWCWGSSPGICERCFAKPELECGTLINIQY